MNSSRVESREIPENSLGNVISRKIINPNIKCQTVCDLFKKNSTFFLHAAESQRSKTSFSDAAVANDKMENSQDLFEDTVIDEEAISQFLNNTLEEENTEKKAADESALYLESDDDELVELLLDLQCEGTNTREEVLSQVKSKDEKYQQEVDDTLEMTQIWNDDDFDKFIANTEAAAENQLDDDTFWEEEFDSDDVLD